VPLGPLLAAVLVVRDVAVVDVERSRLLPHRTVVVETGRITAVGAAGHAKIPDGAEVVDGRGKFLIPGLVDAHLHLTILENGTLAKDVLLPMALRWGVTGIRDMGGDLAQLRPLRDAIAKGGLALPRIATPGPFLDGEGDPPITRVVSRPEDAKAAVAEVAAGGADFVKVQAKLSAETWRAVVAAARASGLTVAGHVPEAVSAFEIAGSGQRTIEHVSPVLPGDAGVMMACTSDEDGLRRERVLLEAYLARDDAVAADAKAMQRAWQKKIIATFDPGRCAQLAKRLVSAGVIWVPTQVWSERFAPLAPERAPPEVDWGAIPEPIRSRWTARRAQVVAASTPEDFAARTAMFEASLRLVRFLHEHGVAIAAGTDGVDTFDLPGDALHREMELLVAAGFTPGEALRAGTLTASRAAGWQDGGAIAPGKRADLVLLDRDPLEDIRAARAIAGIVLAGRYRAAR
jgi:imidazolonepropionase-like amidohydrolase